MDKDGTNDVNSKILFLKFKFKTYKNAVWHSTLLPIVINVSIWCFHILIFSYQKYLVLSYQIVFHIYGQFPLLQNPLCTRSLIRGLFLSSTSVEKTLNLQETYTLMEKLTIPSSRDPHATKMNDWGSNAIILLGIKCLICQRVGPPL